MEHFIPTTMKIGMVMLVYSICIGGDEIGAVDNASVSWHLRHRGCYSGDFPYNENVGDLDILDLYTYFSWLEKKFYLCNKSLFILLNYD